MIKKENLQKLIWVELAIWFVIALALIFTVRHYRIKHLKAQTTYQIFMPDVDGLIVGSPIKFMGVEVGYIDKIKIVGNDVYLKLLITQKGCKLPQGVVATTEFSGLGGSKSLELYPPTKDSIATNNVIFVEPPKRLHDAARLLNDMFEKINSISQKVSSFGLETESLHPGSKNSVDIDGIGNNVNMFGKIIDKMNTNVKNSNIKIRGKNGSSH